MTRIIRPTLSGLIAINLGLHPALATTVIDLEDVTLAPDSFNNGSNGSGKIPSRGADFINTYDATFSSWDGFAVSNQTDVITDGFTNQYAAFTGGGNAGSDNYLIGYENAFAGRQPTVQFGGPVDFATGGGAWITNTTYAALAIRDGADGGFGSVRRFGDPDGNAPDFFLLTIEGFNGANSTGTIPFYLADYRFADNSQDYFIEDWTFVDFSSLGVADRITFSMSSSDNGSFGMNTPAYFAMDSLTIPEPSAAVITLLGIGLTIRRRR